MKLQTVLFIAVCAPAVAFAQPGGQHRSPRPAAPPPKVVAGPNNARFHGNVMAQHPGMPVGPNNAGHTVVYHDPKTNHDENHGVFVDNRPSHIVDRDPHLRVVVRGYHPAHDWTRFHVAHGGWFHNWGIAAWDQVGTVTCEAVNESSGELYPVSQDRDARGWDDDSVNTILDSALDDCYGEANGATCGPATPSCSFQPY